MGLAEMEQGQKKQEFAFDVIQRNTKCHGCDDSIVKGCLRVGHRVKRMYPKGDWYEHFPNHSGLSGKAGKNQATPNSGAVQSKSKKTIS